MALEASWLLWIAAALVVPLGTAVWAVRSPPPWVAEGPLAMRWGRVNTLALGFAAAVAVALTFIYGFHGVDFLRMGLVVIAGSSLAFVFLQSLFSDFLQRYAWRWTLNLASAVTGLTGLAYMVAFKPELEIVIYATLGLVATAALFFVRKMGQSDVRAMQLIVFSVFPAWGIIGLQYTLVLFLALVIAFGAGNAWHKRNWRLFFSRKTSVPMVPIFILPALSASFVLPFLPL